MNKFLLTAIILASFVSVKESYGDGGAFPALSIRTIPAPLTTNDITYTSEKWEIWRTTYYGDCEFCYPPGTIDPDKIFPFGYHRLPSNFDPWPPGGTSLPFYRMYNLIVIRSNLMFMSNGIAVLGSTNLLGPWETISVIPPNIYPGSSQMIVPILQTNFPSMFFKLSPLD